MRITCEITLDIDTKRWSEIADTKGMLASEVRADIRHDMRRVVIENYRAAGLLMPRSPQDAEDRPPRVTPQANAS